MQTKCYLIDWRLIRIFFQQSLWLLLSLNHDRLNNLVHWMVWQSNASINLRADLPKPMLTINGSRRQDEKMFFRRCCLVSTSRCRQQCLLSFICYVILWLCFVLNIINWLFWPLGSSGTVASFSVKFVRQKVTYFHTQQIPFEDVFPAIYDCKSSIRSALSSVLVPSNSLAKWSSASC